MGKMIDITRPDGKTCPAFLEEPEYTRDAPGFVMIQEWWGLNDQMKGLASRLAAEGYRVLVPDLFRGKVTLDANEANHLMDGLDFIDAGRQDIRGCAQYLKRDSTAVGVGGFCMGGALTIIAAVMVEECDAAVCFYGIPPLEAADPSAIRVPFLGHFATHDDWCTPEAVDALESRLKAGGVDYTLYRYNAHHAFMNERRPEVYDKECAELAWSRTLAFLAKTLKKKSG